MSEPLSSQPGLLLYVRNIMDTSLNKDSMRGRIIRFIRKPGMKYGWMRGKVNPHTFKRDKQRLRRKEEREWRKENPDFLDG